MRMAAHLPPLAMSKSGWLRGGESVKSGTGRRYNVRSVMALCMPGMLRGDWHSRRNCGAAPILLVVRCARPFGGGVDRNRPAACA